MKAWVVMREVPYEGGSLEGIFSERHLADAFAKKKCLERIGIYESDRDPYYDKRDNGLEMYHDGDVEWWFYEQEVQS